MMMVKFLLVCCVAAASGLTGFCQEPPGKDDSSDYARAYDLLFPERNMRERAEKAVALLTEGRELSALEPRELSLLCRAYNDLAEQDKQLATARLLWTRDPGSRDATEWMLNSLHNKYVFAEDNKPALEFVDRALKDGKGSARALLVFKAAAIINQKKGLSDAEKRNLASDALIKAYQFEPFPERVFLPGNSTEESVKFQDSPDFIDFDTPFCSFFSAAERESLKLRMREAREKRAAVDSARKQKKARELLTLYGADIYCDEDLGVWDEPNPYYSHGQAYYQATGRHWGHRGGVSPGGPRRLRPGLDEDHSRTIVAFELERHDLSTRRINGGDLREICTLQSLRCISLDGATHLGDTELRHVAGLTQLERLFLKEWRITDDGLVHLSRLTRLRYLSLADTNISDKGLVHLRHMTNLQMLELCNTNVTDNGIKELASLKNLAFLYLHGTNVTKHGVTKLQAALPNCCIVVVVQPGVTG